MGTTDLERRVAAAQDYDMLTGMVFVTGGMLMIAAAVTNNSLFTAVTGLVTPVVQKFFYEHRYGKVNASATRKEWSLRLTVLAVVLFMTGFCIDAFAPQPHVLALPAFASLALAIGWWAGQRHIGLTPWHVAILVLLALSSLAPLAGWHPTDLQVFGPVGLALVALGLLDHHRLTSILGKGTAA